MIDNDDATERQCAWGNQAFVKGWAYDARRLLNAMLYMQLHEGGEVAFLPCLTNSPFPTPWRRGLGD